MASLIIVPVAARYFSVALPRAVDSLDVLGANTEALICGALAILVILLRSVYGAVRSQRRIM
jgi:hypothetical protein